MPATAPNDDHKHHRHAVYASETTGLLLIAGGGVALLFVMVLIRGVRRIRALRRRQRLDALGDQPLEQRIVPGGDQEPEIAEIRQLGLPLLAVCDDHRG